MTNSPTRTPCPAIMAGAPASPAPPTIPVMNRVRRFDACRFVFKERRGPMATAPHERVIPDTHADGSRDHRPAKPHPQGNSSTLETTLRRSHYGTPQLTLVT